MSERNEGLEGLDVWKRVCAEPLFQFLKHEPTGRKVLRLLADGQISIGKAAQSITEKFCLGVEPSLPEAALAAPAAVIAPPFAPFNKDEYEVLARHMAAPAPSSSSSIPASSTKEDHGYRMDTLRDALERSITALDDRLNIHASDHCDEQRVAEAYKRVKERGTISYIAYVQEQNRAALKIANGDSATRSTPQTDLPQGNLIATNVVDHAAQEPHWEFPAKSQAVGERERSMTSQEYVENYFFPCREYIQRNGYADWDGTADGSTITLTGCANMMAKFHMEMHPNPARPQRESGVAPEREIE